MRSIKQELADRIAQRLLTVLQAEAPRLAEICVEAMFPSDEPAASTIEPPALPSPPVVRAAAERRKAPPVDYKNLQRAILVYMRSRPERRAAFSAIEAAVADAQASRNQVRHALVNMRDAGKIVQIGQRRTATYAIPPKG